MGCSMLKKQLLEKNAYYALNRKLSIMHAIRVKYGASETNNDNGES